MNTIFFTRAYNAEATIHRTVESILSQTLGDFKYFILDNGSTDGTEDIIFDYEKTDKRVKALRINHNDITNSAAFWATLIHASPAKYLVWCDADDEYTSDFLENMVGFADENQLDIAACGYEKIDGITNEIIKHRALTENLVLHDRLFADEFIKYRGFTTYTWGKLFSIPFLKATKIRIKERKYLICNDSIIGLMRFREANRAGVFGKAMYKYYQYPLSASNTNIVDSLSSYRDLWVTTKEYLEHYGPISQINEDFLYAINLSLVEEAADRVFAANFPTDVKMGMFAQIFSDPVWAETLARDADPQFKNLAARGEYVNGVKNKILALPNLDENNPLLANIFRHLQPVLGL